jgi:benzodiazapine receptor
MWGRTLPEALQLVISIIACQLAGVIGGLFTGPAIPTWYATLRKPSFTPPGWVFGPVWVTLYVLMGVAAFLVWRKGFDNSQVRIALATFAVQLLLNALWSVVFFGQRSPTGGLVAIGLLWIAILLTIIAFARLSSVAALLLAPYILWVSFAAVLNGAIVRLNP